VRTLPSCLALCAVLAAPPTARAQPAPSGGLPRLLEAGSLQPAGSPAPTAVAGAGWGGPAAVPWRPGLPDRPAHRAPRPLVIVVGSAFAAPWWDSGVVAPAPVPPAAHGARVAPTRVIEVAPASRLPGDGTSGRVPNDTPETALHTEPLGGGLLRVRWTGGGGPVTLLVADSARRVLAEQTVAAAPFTAVFEGAARVAFAGVRAERSDGGTTTTLVPITAARGRRALAPRR
jgi:hypothetical protein